MTFCEILVIFWFSPCSISEMFQRCIFFILRKHVISHDITTFRGENTCCTWSWTFWPRIIRELQFLEFLEQLLVQQLQDFDDTWSMILTVGHWVHNNPAWQWEIHGFPVDVTSPCESGWIYQVTSWFDNQPLGWSPWVTWISTFLSFEGSILGQNGYIMFESFFSVFNLLWLILGILQGLSLYGTNVWWASVRIRRFLRTGVTYSPDSPGTSKGMSRAQGAELGGATETPKLHKLISQRSSILRAGTFFWDFLRGYHKQ